MLAPVAIAAAGVVSPAHAATGSTLYVDDGYGSNCADFGPGTEAQPFCSIQAAANVAQPGQTVLVGTPSNVDDLTYYFEDAGAERRPGGTGSW